MQMLEGGKVLLTKGGNWDLRTPKFDLPEQRRSCHSRRGGGLLYGLIRDLGVGCRACRDLERKGGH